jgi:opacity protein-like surface antigen
MPHTKLSLLALPLGLLLSTSQTTYAQSMFAFDGPYVGLFGGQSETSVKENTLNYANANSGGFTNDSMNSQGKGTVAGISYGYNHRNSGTSTLVWGIDLSAHFNTESSQGMAINASDDWKPVQSSTKIKSLVTLKPKIGAMLGQQTMVYGIAGLAYAKVSRTLTQQSLPDSTASFALFPDNTSATTTANHWGYILGMGIERMITQNVSLKLEVSRIDLGSTNFTHRNTTPIPGNSSNTITQQLKITNTATNLGLNYRF